MHSYLKSLKHKSNEINEGLELLSTKAFRLLGLRKGNLTYELFKEAGVGLITRKAAANIKVTIEIKIDVSFTVRKDSKDSFKTLCQKIVHQSEDFLVACFEETKETFQNGSYFVKTKINYVFH